MAMTAEQRKLSAEAEAAKALAALNLANAEKARVETEQARIYMRKLRGEAQEAEHSAAIKGLEYARDVEKREREGAEDRVRGILRLTGDVDDAMRAACLAQLAEWEHLRTKPAEKSIEVVISSVGGHCHAGVAIYDAIQRMRMHGFKVTTLVYGWALSMAGVILQAGTRRVMGREAWLLIHPIYSHAHGKLGEMEDDVLQTRRWNERLLRIYAARSKLSLAEIRKRSERREWWIDSSEAKRFGFVDEVACG